MLTDAPTVTAALYDAGYESPSRFYADAGARLGMTPSAWRDGGRGVTIRWALADTLANFGDRPTAMLRTLSDVDTPADVPATKRK